MSFKAWSSAQNDRSKNEQGEPKAAPDAGKPAAQPDPGREADESKPAQK